MTGSADRLHRWIFLLTAGFLFAAAVLRSVISIGRDPLLAVVLVMLLVWLALFVLEAWVTPRWPPFFFLYVPVQAAIAVVLMGRVDSGDYYAVLFGILSMQAMQRLGWKPAVAWIVLFTPLTALPLTRTYDVPQAIVFALIYAVVDAFLAFFAVTTRQAAEARVRNQALADEQRVANREIEVYSRRLEQLAAAEERHRLARELHDSVTQTIFSMNLTAQSAELLLARGAGAAAAQLERLEELTQGALAEIHALGSELAPAALGEGGLAAALRRHLEERDLSEGLSVRLEVEDEAAGQTEGAGQGDLAAGPGGLSAAEELGLFRIAQEALNNIVKHAQASEAAIRLRLSPRCRLEIEDDGRGFDLAAGESAGGMGLTSMRERAAEIGWCLRVAGSPGAGTRIVVEQGTGGVEAELIGAGAEPVATIPAEAEGHGGRLDE